MAEKALASIVIVAQTFNPSIFTETWLNKNDLISADKLVGARIFSPEVAQFGTSQMQILVIPQKLQITFPILQGLEDFGAPIEFSKGIIKLLPHTPFKAVGLNFNYFYEQKSENEFNVYNRKLLGDGDYKLLKEFSSADAKFGRYFSKDYMGFRLRLDIKPVKVEPDKKEMLEFAFNFHHDLSEEDSSKSDEVLIGLISNWNNLFEYSAKLLELGSEL